LALEEYFFEVVPDYDEDRVYPSDIKKVIQWYNLLVEHDLADFSDPDADPETPAADATPDADETPAADETTKE
jgi:uncharacterized protein YdaT